MVITPAFEQAQIKRMKPHVAKLVKLLSQKDIKFDDGSNITDGIKNVTFTLNDKVMDIMFHCFYRYSGIAYIYRENEKKEKIPIEVTDAMCMNSYMLSAIETFFFPKIKEENTTNKIFPTLEEKK
jgi:hypothetical protein